MNIYVLELEDEIVLCLFLMKWSLFGGMVIFGRYDFIVFTGVTVFTAPEL